MTGLPAGEAGFKETHFLALHLGLHVSLLFVVEALEEGAEHALKRPQSVSAHGTQVRNASKANFLVEVAADFLLQTVPVARGAHCVRLAP